MKFLTLLEDNMEKYPCPQCDMSFTKHSADEYRKHVEYHDRAIKCDKLVTPTNYPCLDCTDVFTEYYDLKRHMKNAHPKYKFRCRDKTMGGQKLKCVSQIFCIFNTKIL